MLISYKYIDIFFLNTPKTILNTRRNPYTQLNHLISGQNIKKKAGRREKESYREAATQAH